MFREVTADPYKLLWETGEDKMLIVSIGTGSAPRLGPTSLHPSRSLIEVAVSIAGEMMNGMAYDQDVNCRTVGRCVFGPNLDREVWDLVSPKPLSENLGRAFLYARYDPELTREGLDALGFGTVSPKWFRNLIPSQRSRTSSRLATRMRRSRLILRLIGEILERLRLERLRLKLAH